VKGRDKRLPYIVINHRNSPTQEKEATGAGKSERGLGKWEMAKGETGLLFGVFWPLTNHGFVLFKPQLFQ